MKKLRLSFLFLILLQSSCATVKFYSDKELKSESGIEFYTPKPFLIVENNPAKDVSVKMSIVYLPDFEKPKFAKIKAGLGSSDLKITLENGIITSYGVTTDTKIPETISSISGLVTGVGSTYKSLAEAIDILKKEKGETEQSGDIGAMDDTRKIISLLMLDVSKEVAGQEGFVITQTQKNNFKALSDTLTEIDKKLVLRRTIDIPVIAKSINSSIEILNALKTNSDSDKAKNFNGRIDEYKRVLTVSLNKLLPLKTESSSIDIYEIITENKSTILKKVKTQ